MTNHAEPSRLTLALAARIRHELEQRRESIGTDELLRILPVPARAVRDALDYLKATGEVAEQDTGTEPGETGT